MNRASTWLTTSARQAERLQRRPRSMPGGLSGVNKRIDTRRVWAFNMHMTALLDKAISRVSDLPAKKQNEVARFLLAELDADARWDTAFESSQDELSVLATVARAERRQGKTRKMDLAHDF